MALKDSVACQRDSVSDTLPVHNKGLSTPVESVPSQVQREEQASGSQVNITPTAPISSDQSVLLNIIFTLFQANCNTAGLSMAQQHCTFKQTVCTFRYAEQCYF